MESSSPEIPVAVAVKVSSLNDLVRLASVNAARMSVSPLYRFKHGEKIFYMVQTVYKDFYKQYGVPIVYYYSEPLGGGEDRAPAYVLVKVDENGEAVELGNRVKPGWLAIPVVNLEGKPAYVPDDIT
ncbi:hypothetical protein apy_01480 [Aeropyrum pernix]|uniref:Cren protein n=1 Tax=Aeropyrum pernix TaxID=56636 RepID=A0A401H7N9_AERPX|nr:hypothetical protein [Aeropyrum pernix]GBF08423.1 hypothetical protein apy_01480 [Aeropyrum pernix]